MNETELKQKIIDALPDEPECEIDGDCCGAQLTDFGKKEIANALLPLFALVAPTVEEVDSIMTGMLTVTDEWGGIKIASWQYGHALLIDGIDETADAIRSLCLSKRAQPSPELSEQQIYAMLEKLLVTGKFTVNGVAKAIMSMRVQPSPGLSEETRLLMLTYCNDEECLFDEDAIREEQLYREDYKAKVKKAQRELEAMEGK